MEREVGPKNPEEGRHPSPNENPSDYPRLCGDRVPNAATKQGGLPRSRWSLSTCERARSTAAASALGPTPKKSGETDKRPFQSRRDGTIVTDAECTVLALTEAVTRIGERADSVPDEIWDEATGHYDGRALAA